jgi:hypothetical protein
MRTLKVVGWPGSCDMEGLGDRGYGERRRRTSPGEEGQVVDGGGASGSWVVGWCEGRTLRVVEDNTPGIKFGFLYFYLQGSDPPSNADPRPTIARQVKLIRSLTAEPLDSPFDQDFYCRLQ